MRIIGGDREVLQFYKAKKKIEPITVIFIIFLVLLIGSVSYLLLYLYQGSQNRGKINDLNMLLDHNRSDNSQDRFASVRGEYPDIVARIKLNYYNDEKVLPIMQTTGDEGKDPQYYLYRDVNGNHSDWGTIFMDYRDVLDADKTKSSTNLIIYGHNMRDMSMFGGLGTYKKKEYFDKYPTVKFETKYEEEKEYKIFATMNARIYNKDDNTSFKYYNFINAQNEEEFDKFIQDVKSNQCYETGITPKYGDKLITLSTCDNSLYGDAGRFVVFAVLSSSQ